MERRGTIKIFLLAGVFFTQAKYQTANNVGKRRMMAPLSKEAKPWINRLTSCIRKTAVTPRPVPKNAPEIGANRSKRVNLTRDPTRVLTEICKAIKPKMTKIKRKRSFPFVNLNLEFISNQE